MNTRSVQNIMSQFLQDHPEMLATTLSQGSMVDPLMDQAMHELMERYDMTGEFCWLALKERYPNGRSHEPGVTTFRQELLLICSSGHSSEIIAETVINLNHHPPLVMGNVPHLRQHSAIDLKFPSPSAREINQWLVGRHLTDQPGELLRSLLNPISLHPLIDQAMGEIMKSCPEEWQLNWFPVEEAREDEQVSQTLRLISLRGNQLVTLQVSPESGTAQFTQIEPLTIPSIEGKDIQGHPERERKNDPETLNLSCRLHPRELVRLLNKERFVDPHIDRAMRELSRQVTRDDQPGLYWTATSLCELQGHIKNQGISISQELQVHLPDGRPLRMIMSCSGYDPTIPGEDIEARWGWKIMNQGEAMEMLQEIRRWE